MNEGIKTAFLTEIISPTEYWSLLKFQRKLEIILEFFSSVKWKRGELGGVNIYEGKNGYVYRKGDINTLFGFLKQILNQNLKQMGEESFRIIQRFSPQRCA